MKKSILLAIIIALIAVPAYAAVRSISNARSATDDSVQFQVSSTSTLYTKHLIVSQEQIDQEIGIFYRAVTTGTINLMLEIEQSFRPAATDGSADSNYIITDVIDSSITTDSKWFLATLDTVVMPYIRFKVTGQGANAVDTLFEIKVSK